MVNQIIQNRKIICVTSFFYYKIKYAVKSIIVFFLLKSQNLICIGPDTYVCMYVFGPGWIWTGSAYNAIVCLLLTYSYLPCPTSLRPKLKSKFFKMQDF